MPVHKAGKKNRKHGRNLLKCQWYRRTHKREKNKIRKLTKLMRRQPNNKQLPNAIRRLKNQILE